jgi:hypothetical protein
MFAEMQEEGEAFILECPVRRLRRMRVHPEARLDVPLRFEYELSHGIRTAASAPP